MPTRPIRPTDLLDLSLVGDPRMSPSGQRVLFSKKTITSKNQYLSHLFTVDLEGLTKPWTSGADSCGAGRWSPDERWISFVSKRTGDTSQIFLISTQGGEAFQLTGLPEGTIGAYEWSPDSTKIVLSFRQTRKDATVEAGKERAEKGLSAPPIVFNDIKYRLDGDGYFADDRFQMMVFDVEKASKSSGDFGASVLHRYSADAHGNYDFCWAPDSLRIAIVHSVNPHPFVDPPNDQIWIWNCEDGAVDQLPGLPTGEKTAPRWSPDGAWIAYGGSVDEADPWGVRNTRLFVVNCRGGELRELTEGQDIDCAVATLSDTKDAGFGVSMHWASDSTGLYLQIGTRGETQLGFAPLSGGVKLLTEGRHELTIGNLSPHSRKVAALSATATRPAEVAVLEPELVTGKWVAKLLTDFNDNVLSEVELIEPEEQWIDTTDGLKVHAWVLRPLNASGTSPAVLQIHGGPHAQYGWTFFHELQCQAAEGFVVVYSNPRGSCGYGEAWTAAIQGHWGTKDWEDIQAVTNWMAGESFIDPQRIAIMGGSYGGYMTNWAIGHSDRYRCAITDRCVSNMVSMAGNSDFPVNKNGYFGGIAYGDLSDIASLWEQSPIAYFKNVKTPTLIIHSAGDLRCNIEQGEQVFSALQMEGVESRMVRYPESTSHGMSRSGPPDLRLHRLGEILNWLKNHLC